MLRIVENVCPRGILIENVRGIMSARFESYRAQLAAAFDRLGFDTHWEAFNATDFGVPQKRLRVFIVALRRGETSPLKWPIPVDGRPPTVGGSHKHGGPDLGPTTRARREWMSLGVDGLGLANEARRCCMNRS